jgi:hypothetical protein
MRQIGDREIQITASGSAGETMAEIPPSGRGLRIFALSSNEENVAGLCDGRLIRYVIP